ATTAWSRMWWMSPGPWTSPATGTKPRFRTSTISPSAASRPSARWLSVIASEREWSGVPCASSAIPRTVARGPLATQAQSGVGGDARLWKRAMRIADTVALVTGGASGLGGATVRAFAERGGRVVVMDRPNSDGAAVAKQLGGLFTPADVSSPDEVEAAV